MILNFSFLILCLESGESWLFEPDVRSFIIWKVAPQVPQMARTQERGAWSDAQGNKTKEMICEEAEGGPKR